MIKTAIRYATIFAAAVPLCAQAEAITQAPTQAQVELDEVVVTGDQNRLATPHDIELDPSLSSKLVLPVEELARSTLLALSSLMKKAL